MTRAEAMQLDEIHRTLGALENGQAAIISRQDRTDVVAAEERAAQAARMGEMNAKLDALIVTVANATGGWAVGKLIMTALAACVGALWAAFMYLWPPKH